MKIALSPIEQFITELSRRQSLSREDIFNLQRKYCKRFKRTDFFRKDELIATYRNLVNNHKIKENIQLGRALILKKVRSLSGIVVVSVLSKPYPCPGKCLYCPTEKGVPKSYDPQEPAVMRAILCKFDPYIQVTNRLRALINIGHPIDKLNVRIIGGTWSYYPKNYQTWFIKRIFQAVNEYSLSKRKNTRTLKQLQRINEKAQHRIVEISVETRQDFINEVELKRLRKFGVTKIELGVQSLDDKILKLNRRGHKVAETIRATKLIRDAGFKVAYQMMVNLYGANPASDKKMFKQLFSSSDFCPDYLKIYPLALVKSANIFKLYQQKKYRPYNQAELLDVIRNAKLTVPYYVRIERIIRDIPTHKIIAGGAKISNMRQVLKLMDVSCRCIRCREVRDDKKEKIYLFVDRHDASGGQEFFISFENKSRTKLFSILRLRIPSQFFDHKKHFISALNNAAIIREVHTYGRQIQISQKDKDASQHFGLGKKLIAEAEKIAKKYGLKKIAVISGVGARQYFRRLGYRLSDSYMVKNIIK